MNKEKDEKKKGFFYYFTFEAILDAVSKLIVDGIYFCVRFFKSIFWISSGQIAPNFLIPFYKSF